LPDCRDGGDWRRQALVLLGRLALGKDTPYVERYRAIVALVSAAEPGVMAFMQALLKQPDPWLRQLAIAAAPRLEPTVAIALLEPALADADSGVRRLAAFALAATGDQAAEKPLLTALLGADDSLTRAVAEALALSGGNGWQILEEALSEQELRLRRAAVAALALLDEFWAVRLLERVQMEDDEWFVRSAAGEALEAMAARNAAGEWRPTDPGDQPWLIEWAARSGQAIPAGDAARPVLYDTVANGSEPGLQALAGLALGRLLDPGAIPALSRAVEDPNLVVRDTAYGVLSHIRRAWAGHAMGSDVVKRSSSSE
jgi:HEAT repeat protein